jgi:Double-GTPase 1
MTDSALTLMVGLPETGKTTYLAALYNLLDEGGGVLVLDRLAGDTSYFNRIRSEWQKCEPTVRTTSATKTAAPPVYLRDKDGRVTDLRVPDVSGESYNEFWENRAWPETFDSLVQAANGLLLFVHPDFLHEPEFLDELEMVAGPEPPSEIHPDAAAASKETEWSPEQAADQVKLVDLLQSVQARAGRALPVAVVVSAWDVVQESGGDIPSRWFEARVPLLAQYLDANSSTFPRRVWGVSAQGGSLPTKKDELIKTSPSDRVSVVFENEGVSNDLTAPIAWLIAQA